MRLEQNIKQQQKLILTSHMQQFMHVLQLSNIELMDTISGQIEENPFLIEETPLPRREEFFAPPKPRNFLSDFNFEDTLQDAPSMVEKIQNQILLNFHDIPSQRIAQHFILFLDESGYFRADLSDLSLKLGTNIENLERILNVMQSFDPIGIFARDLKECFKIQLKDQDSITPMINRIIDSLDYLTTGNMKELLKASGSKIEDVQSVIQKLKTLDPKPGFQSSESAFGAGHIVPDLYLDIDEGGKWSLSLNPDLVPKLSLHQELFQKSMLANITKDEEGFIKEKYSGAAHLIKVIQQRNDTLLRIANEVATTQRLFFTQGIHFMKPLTLKKVAEQLGVHESTVSRGCSNKYIATPRGTFELKFFFQSGVTDTDGDAVSSAQIIYHIKNIISTEASKKPHSDEELTGILNAKGIQVARRTVAKYREEAGIPSSSVRKRQRGG